MSGTHRTGEGGWIAVDWGTSRLRAWAVDAGGGILGRAESEDGMGRLAPEDFEPALLRLAEGWLAAAGTTPVRACGMVGARTGWVEAAYRAVPCPPLAPGGLTRAGAVDPRLDVRIVPGLSQAAPPDVMRGEETQIAGFLAAEPAFDGVLCLPGTHDKWVRISAGEVVSFQTFMTGELYELLSRRSVLRHGLGGNGTGAGGWDDGAFAEAVGDALSRPERVAGWLFGLRAAALLEGMAPEAARARLSGMLIGMELAAARPYWLGQAVVVIGAPGLSGLYETALAGQGLGPRVVDAEPLTLAGLGVARRQETES